MGTYWEIIEHNPIHIMRNNKPQFHTLQTLIEA